MRLQVVLNQLLLVAALCLTGANARAQQPDACAALSRLKETLRTAHFESPGVEITKAEPVPAGIVIPPSYPGGASIGPLPAHCRVDGVINRRKGVDGEEFGISFAVTLPAPEAWKGDLMMQGGGG